MAGMLPMLQLVPQKENCAEWDRLLRQFIAATGDLIAIQTQDSPEAFPTADSGGADQMLRRAVVEKFRAKTALLQHLRGHRHCGEPEWLEATSVSSHQLSPRQA